MMSSSEWDAVVKCSATGRPGELFRMLRSEVLTEAFPQTPSSFTNVQAAEATTNDGVHHILRLTSEAVPDGIDALGAL